MATTNRDKETFAREIEELIRPTLRYMQLTRRNRWPGDNHKLDNFVLYPTPGTKQEKVLRGTLKHAAQLQKEEEAGKAIYANLQDMMNRMRFEELRARGLGRL